MRKASWILAALAVLCLIGIASEGTAEVAGTAHSSNYTLAKQGDCSACHMPHAVGAKRLWPEALDNTSQWGTLGDLCYYCHSASGGNALTEAVSDNTVFHGSAHGVGTTANPDGNASNDPNLPYATTGGVIECTSCHNPHDDTNRPFMVTKVAATTIFNLCSKCHPSRGNGATDWSGYGSGNTTGSHPVGANVNSDLDNNSDINLDTAALAVRPDNNAKGDYRLGAKLVGFASAFADNGMSCVTCHAVHGSESGDHVIAFAPGEDLLAVSGTGSISGHANGGVSTTARNILCEGCHIYSGDFGAGANTIDGATGIEYAGSLRPNPGHTQYTHPADDLGAYRSAGVPDGSGAVSPFPAITVGGSESGEWPARNAVGGNVGTGPICESCHIPHAAASATAQSDLAPANVPSGTHLMRDSDAVICNACHTGTLTGHHPVGPMGRFETTTLTVSGTTLGCSTCHAGGTNGAHNWTGRGGGGLALVSAWLPSQNLRPHTAGQNDNNMSSMCIECHLAGATLTSPTPNDNNAGGAVTGRSVEYRDYGDSSHYLGLTSLTYANGKIGTDNAGTAFNALTTGWDNTQGQGGMGGFSLFSTATGGVVCESCHTLKPDYAAPGTALLLAYYSEGTTDTNQQQRSQFCTGCHGDNPGGKNPHPMTGFQVSKAADIGRSPATLITTTGSYANRVIGQSLPGGWDGESTYPAADTMNCDSCHQPHDTPTAAGTWIIDSKDTSVTGTATGNSRPSGDTVPNYQTFCLECHIY